ncbi:MAG: hypothetical protein HC911_13505, partial [Chloroflexaceae bacterium]|nr:hypothetical protein [Chloroflexaceae bacterium]
MRRSRLIATRTQRSASFTRALLGIMLALLVAVPFVSPKHLLLTAGDIFAPTTAHAVTDCVAQTDVPQAECETLIAFYNATDGANWNNNSIWGQGNNVCGWVGVACDDSGVSRLFLANNNLNGSIPPDLGSLANLQEISLGGNQLNGSIPPLDSLANLQTLDLS